MSNFRLQSHEQAMSEQEQITKKSWKQAMCKTGTSDERMKTTEHVLNN